MNVRVIHSFRDVLSVTDILHACGKDMARKYDIHHWDNLWIKTFLIVVGCLMRNRVSVVEDERIVATYQTKVKDSVLYFQKLAVKPSEGNRGIGSFCLNQIEQEATERACSKVQMDVYSKSQHAIQFYKKHGYSQMGEDKTLKYNVICLEKVLI